jgi:hypothetical protein
MARNVVFAARRVVAYSLAVVSERYGIDVIRQLLQSGYVIWFQGLDCSPGLHRVVINDDGMEV